MQEAAKLFLENGFLLEPKFQEIINKINQSVAKEVVNVITSVIKQKIISSEVFLLNIDSINKKLDSIKEKKSPSVRKQLEEIINYFSSLKVQREEKSEENEEIAINRDTNDFKILKSYAIKSKKISVDDFVSYFRNRFNALKNIIQNKPEVDNLTSIGKIQKEKQKVSIIGLVFDKRTTKNKNVILKVEDMTGVISVLIHNSKPELIEMSKDIVLDEVLGFDCNGNNEILFVNKIIFPDIYVEKKIAKNEDCLLFIADLHVGSKNFLEDKFLDFIKWINGEAGSDEQKEVAKKISYLFVVGDIIEGVGIYPGQEELSSITNVTEQYQKCAELFSKIRKDIKIIICPGNHDALRLSEPQPLLDKQFAAALYALENVYMVSNPALVSVQDIPIFLYHGYPFDYYSRNIDSIRFNKGHEHPDIIIHFLLKKRHLAPIHASCLYVPYGTEDSLVVSNAPNVFVSAHMHKSAVSTYNGVLTISCSCWQSKTPAEEKIGHEPDPCKVPLLDLKTGKVRMMDFS